MGGAIAMAELDGRAVIGTHPKLRACATELADDFQRNWKRKGALLGASVPVLSNEVLAATLYGLLYSGTILCPKPEHRIGLSFRKAPHTSRTADCPRCKQDGVIHCDRCNGSGRAVGDVADCPDCQGAGNLGPKP